MAVYLWKYMLGSLFATIVVEIFIGYHLKIRNKKDLCLLLLVNIVTNPIAVLSYYCILYFLTFPTLLVKILIEVFVVVCEWIYYRKYSIEIKKPFQTSIILNVVSFCIGLLID